MRLAELAFIEAARARAAGAPSGLRYQSRLESLIAAYDDLAMVDPRVG